MTIKSITKTLTIACLAATSAYACAWEQQPVENISSAYHGNLAAAQTSIRQAFRDIDAAQNANHGELGGHAERAKQLLDEASNELKAAAETANLR
ncbi:hypothetical protein PQQ99_33715 [Paraburkholderia sediminicola]|uniref:hypothetical protein n=1 Tax=Paraburkholderia sediminicola TaxID=458836 RepID=UPI0038B890FD